MKLWIDGDACPKPVKEIVFRAAARAKVETILVANMRMYVPPSPFIKIVQVDQGPDAADAYIADACEAGDLVVTADIPLAARIVKKGALGLDPRGRLYDGQTIGEALNMRDFMDSLRGSGIETGGAAAFSASDRNEFANALDRFLTRAARGG
jgi:uncharacterized protein